MIAIGSRLLARTGARWPRWCTRVGLVLEPLRSRPRPRARRRARSSAREREAHLLAPSGVISSASSRAPRAGRGRSGRASRLSAAASIASITSSSESRERVDVLAVDRRHERAVQALDDVVREVVAAVLDRLHLAGARQRGRVGAQDRLEHRGALSDGVGHRGQVGEEALFARDQPKAGHVVSFPVRGADARGRWRRCGRRERRP